MRLDCWNNLHFCIRRFQRVISYSLCFCKLHDHEIYYNIYNMQSECIKIHHHISSHNVKKIFTTPPQIRPPIGGVHPLPIAPTRRSGGGHHRVFWLEPPLFLFPALHPFSSPFLSSPSRPCPNAARGTDGERCKLPQRSPERSPWTQMFF